MKKLRKLNYSEKAMNAMKHSIINDWKLGKTCEYQINIDSIPIVRRTDDIELFDYYKEVLYEEAEQVEVWVFPKKTSLYTQKYIFLHTPETDKSQSSLEDKEPTIKQLKSMLKTLKEENEGLINIVSKILEEALRTANPKGELDKVFSDFLQRVNSKKTFKYED